MASESARQGATSFCGGHLPSQYQRTTLQNVPTNDDGLRHYTSNGEWSMVLTLSRQLEAEAAAVATTAASAEDPTGPLMAARLPYVLVQATALFKLRRYAEAQKLLDDTLAYGNEMGLDGVEVPFSLRFLAALLPKQLSRAAESEKLLLQLLDEVQRPVVMGEPNDDRRRLRHHRERRVRHALIHLYVTRGQTDLAISMLQELIQLEEEEEEQSHDSTSVRQLCHVLRLQQFACVCLSVGRFMLAHELFSHMEHLAEQQEVISDSAVATLYQHIVGMNEGFALVFYGQFSDATRRFRSLAEEMQAAEVAFTDTFTDNVEEAEVVRQMEGLLMTSAQASHVSCMALEASDQSTRREFTVMPSLMSTMEDYLRTHPQAWCQSDALLGVASRFYTLRGRRSAPLARLADLVEVFCCERSAIPPLEKLV